MIRRMKTLNRELGWIEFWPICMLPAVTLWKISGFRRVMWRDIGGKCYKGFGLFNWVENNRFKGLRR